MDGWSSKSLSVPTYTNVDLFNISVHVKNISTDRGYVRGLAVECINILEFEAPFASLNITRGLF